MISELIWLCTNLNSTALISVVSDLVIAVSYFIIPVVIAAIVWHKWQYIQYKSILLLFIGFILACGVTHLVHTFEMPSTTYSHSMLETITKVVCALLSAVTACVVAIVLPKIIKIQTAEERLADLEDLVKLRTKQKDILIAEVNHRTGNALQVIASAISYRRRGELTPEQEELLDFMQTPLDELIQKHVTASSEDFHNVKNIQDYAPNFLKFA